MKLHSIVGLHVCLYTTLSVNLMAPAAGAVKDGAASADVLNRPPKAAIEILDAARSANDHVYALLQSFVCNEQINRFRGSLDGQTARALDTVTAKLSFERGIEQYANVMQNNHPRPAMASLAGAWSEGEFGTLLLETQQMLNTRKVDFDNFAEFKGQQTAVYHFEVTEEQSPWDLTVSDHHYRLPFRTNVWISIHTGEILKIQRATTHVPSRTHISGIEWCITLDHFSLNGHNWLLPSSGIYAVLYNESRHKEWNQISFTGYQRYGAETAIKFE